MSCENCKTLEQRLAENSEAHCKAENKLIEKLRQAEEKDSHEGDCTIYASLENQQITDGICTCGKALNDKRRGDGNYQEATEEYIKRWNQIAELRERNKLLEEGAISLTKFKEKFEAFKRYQQQHLYKGLEAAEQSWAEVSDSGMLDFSDLFDALTRLKGEE